MSESVTLREKRLSIGARVSGSFGDFYSNPDPNVKRRKRLRIYGVVQAACGPRQYRVCFDSGLIVDCFSNTLRLEKSSASVPSDELEAAVLRVEHTDNVNVNDDAIVVENEAAANDIEMEEHMPESQDADLDDDNLVMEDSTESTEEEQRPVGVLESNDASTTYAGRKEAANRRIASLRGTIVTMNRGRSEKVDWIVVDESKAEKGDVSKGNVGLNGYSELMNDAHPGTFIAQLFLLIMYDVSVLLFYLHCFSHTNFFSFFFFSGLESKSNKIKSSGR
jgi:hypothetical protein